jgi:HD domain-containing protein
VPDFPDTALCLAALALAREHEHPAILNHSLRTFRHGEHAAQRLDLRPGADYDREELFVACVLHDIGTADAYDGAQRFEVEGADAAAAFLAAHDIAAPARGRVWEAIALHTSPGIAERLGPLTRLTRAGVVADFARSTATARGFEADHPRLDVERHLADAVVRQALANPTKAPPASWPGQLLRAHRAGAVDPAF